MHVIILQHLRDFGLGAACALDALRGEFLFDLRQGDSLGDGGVELVDDRELPKRA